MTGQSPKSSPVAALLDGAWGEFENSWFKAWKLRHEALPHRLYHYTTHDCVQSIVNSQAMRATNARCLADSSELVYIDDVIDTVIDKLRRRYPDGLPRTFLDATSEQLLDTLRDSFQVYVTCFCVDEDKLSQWCRYAPTGYAVGFDPEPMRTGTQLRLRSIVYDRVEQERLVCEVLEFFADSLSSQSSAGIYHNVTCVAALQETAHVLSECLFCFKRPSFREEQEWRLVHIVAQELHQVNTPVRFHQGRNGRASYVELHPNGQPPGVSGQLPIREVVMSPNLTAAATKSAIRSLLASARYRDDTQVRNSVIPLKV